MTAAGEAPQRSWRMRLDDRIRAIPIRWRIFAIAALNSMVVVLLAAMIWDGARVLSMAWNDVRQLRQSERVLVSLESETVRLQSLIHRYFNQPQAALLADIEARRFALHDALKSRSTLDRTFAASLGGLIDHTERFLSGFDALRDVRTAISRVYENEILRPAGEIARL